MTTEKIKNYKQVEAHCKLLPATILDDLDYKEVIQLAAQYAVSVDGQNMILNTEISTQYDEINYWLNRADELRLLLKQSPLQLLGFESIIADVKLLGIENYILDIYAMLRIKNLLQNIRNVREILKAPLQHGYLILQDELHKFHDLNFILDRLYKIIDREGKIHDHASPALLTIRQQLKSKQNEIYKTFKKHVTQYRQLGYLAEGEESIRNGRLVLRVLSEYRRQIKGIIHDESESGKTVFLEPQELVELNNDIFDLESEERKEIQKILSDLCKLMHPYAEELGMDYANLVNWDSWLAKVKFSISIDGLKPELSQEYQMSIKDGKHPLLFLKLKELNRKLVPFSLYLNEKNRILILSGPNAGGKSVILKSLGLLQLMVQSGFLVPVAKGSVFNLFKVICADIGDHQSMDDALSTYSAKLANMRDFEAHASRDSLILIDEFGSGTEPHMGGAIAESLLFALNKKYVFGVINTHYTNLKTFAHKHSGLVNGAMIFDEKNLSPTYQLQVGRPGSSYAFEIAEKNNLPAHIIAYAKQRVGNQTVSFEQLLAKLDQESSVLQKEIAEYNTKKIGLDKLIKSYQDMQRQLDVKKLKLRLEEKQSSIQHAALKLKELDRYSKELRKDQDEVKLRDKVEKEKAEYKKNTEEFYQLNQEIQFHEQSKKDTPIVIGDAVKLILNGMIGKVVAIDNDKITVITEHMTFKLKLKEIIKLKSVIDIQKAQAITTNTIRSNEPFNATLDMRGMKIQEAQLSLESFIDKALLANVNAVNILHGKGSGILKETVARTLRGQNYVKKLFHPSSDQGGDGITIVELR